MQDDEVSQLLADLTRWTAESRATEEAGSRRRRAWLAQQAREDTSLSTLILGWAEGTAQVNLRTRSGAEHRGRLVAAGRDFVLLAPGYGPIRAVLVATGAIAFIRHAGALDGGPAELAAGGESAPSRGTRPPERRNPHDDPAPGSEDGEPSPAEASSVVDLAAALAGLAADRPRVRMVAGQGEAIVGELRWVGCDVACLGLDSPRLSSAYVALANLAEVSVLGG